MRKIHISLVGGQTMPIYIGFQATGYDLALLVHSKESMKEAKHIKANIQKAALYELPTVDYDNILIQSEALLNQFKDDEVFVNVSGGIKTWTVAFTFLSVSRSNVTLIYIDQNNDCIDLTHKKKQIGNYHLGITDILRYNHQKPSGNTPLSTYTSRDVKAMKQIRQLRSFKIKDFNQLTLSSVVLDFKNSNEDDSFHYELSTGSSITYDREKRSYTMFLTKYGKQPMRLSLSSPHIDQLLFNAGWMEFQVAHALGEWSQAKEVWLNVKFPYIQGKVKNELDVIVSTGSRLLFVECKTQIYNTTDIDKFRTAVKNYGGTSSKALFITDTIQMKPEAAQKCADSEIMAFCWRGHGNDDETKAALFDLLDHQMKNINKK